jgi:hypothetical protein
MSGYVKNNLRLIAQGITGGKLWDLTDTGAIGDVQEAAGYITNAGDMGMDTGDYVVVHATDGVLTKVVRGSAVMIVQDTGATQGTLGLSVLVGDTS